MTCVSWAGHNDNQNQFAYVDEMGSLTLWNLDKKTYYTEHNISNSILNTCALEQVNTRLLACGGLDTRICIFNINRKEEIGRITKAKDLTDHTGMITCCSFLDETHLISGSSDSTFLLWDISTAGRSLRQFLDHEAEVACLDVCEQNGNILVSGSGDTTVRVWDIRIKEACVRIFDTSKHSINDIKFMPNRETTLAAGDDDGVIRLLDIRAIGSVGEYKAKDKEVVKSMAFSKSGRILFTAYKGTGLVLWDVITEQIINEIPEAHGKQVNSLAMSVDGLTLLTAGKDGFVRMWTRRKGLI